MGRSRCVREINAALPLVSAISLMISISIAQRALIALKLVIATSVGVDWLLDAQKSRYLFASIRGLELSLS